MASAGVSTFCSPPFVTWRSLLPPNFQSSKHNHSNATLLWFTWFPRHPFRGSMAIVSSGIRSRLQKRLQALAMVEHFSMGLNPASSLNSWIKLKHAAFKTMTSEWQYLFSSSQRSYSSFLSISVAYHACVKFLSSFLFHGLRLKILFSW